MGNRKKKVKSKDLEHNFPNFVSPKQPQIIPSDPVVCFELFFNIEVVEFLLCLLYMPGGHNFDLPIHNVKCYRYI